MSINLLLIIAALVFMLLAAFKVPESRVSWFHLSLSCLIATLLI